ncbi:methionine adenosyltransferase 2 subunit beta-like [Diadema antillarum]|uniref:methionine adenosyltransferase 2 subunit beta-like n=1 Tax=Diadema antillarum TaxID=105358 RepID=UPI003A88AF39
MRILVTGASGLLGRALMKELQACPTTEPLGLAFSRAKDGLRKVDIRSEEEVRAVMQEFKPNAVIHAAVERRPDVVEVNEERAKKVNCDATEVIGKLSAEFGAYVIFISTDYVFDGTSPPYKPSDATNPLNKYGRQKLEGEKIIRATNQNSAVLRIPILYGPLETIEESAVTILVKTIRNKDKTDLIDDVCTRCPTHVQDIAVVCRQMCERWEKDPASVTQIFHWCGGELMTKYAMATTIADLFQLPHEHLRPNPVQPTGGTLRPKDCTMDRTKLEELGIGQTTSFREGMKEALAPFMKT